MPVGNLGATVTADGIAPADRGTYAFQPPAAFFDAGAIPTGASVFNILDYGAKADPAYDNRAEIQAAIDAAHQAGGGIVYVPPGTYGIGASFRADGVTPNPSAGGIQLLDNVFLKGAGIGESSLRVLDGQNQPITGIVRSPPGEVTSNFGVADLSLDGNRANNPTAKIDGFYCGTPSGSGAACSDVYVLRVEAQNCSGYGFDPNEQTNRLSITGCVAHGNGLDGFTEDFQVDGEFRDNIAYGNDRHGFNIVSTTSASVFIGNIAYDNGGAGIVIQRGGTVSTGPSNILIEGGEVYGNGSDGIRINSADNVLVSAVDIHDNGRNGVRIEGSSNITVANCTLTDNAQVIANLAGASAEIQIMPIDDGGSDRTRSATGNLIAGNTITVTDEIHATFGVREYVGGASTEAVGNNWLVDNTIAGFSGSLVQIVGSTSAIVQHGTDDPDLIAGGPGIDYLFGGDGDRLNGGDGNDIYILDGDSGRIQEAADGGFDTQIATMAGIATLATNVEQLILTGNATHGIGTGSNDTIQVSNSGAGVTLEGNGGDDVLIGGTGNDNLSGGSGDDVLIGSGGSNTLRGGTGDDVYIITSATDSVIEARTAGFDTMFTTAAGVTVMAANVEQLVLAGSATGGVGTGGNDIIAAIDVAGTVTIDGAGGDDVIFGGAGNDALAGGAGDDILCGGAGSNTLDGGGGDDVYILTSGNDTIVERADGGIDVVYSMVAGTTTLSDNVEHLILAGPATGGVGTAEGNVISVDVSAGAVVIDGAGGDDYLFGGSGNDRIIGGTGDDYLVGGGGTDIFDFRSATSGTDTIADFTSGPGSAHDMIDVSGRGFSALSIGASIVIADDADGAAMIQIGTDTIKLLGMHAADITANDFIF